jgi:hypothetical protein
MDNAGSWFLVPMTPITAAIECLYVDELGCVGSFAVVFAEEVPGVSDRVKPTSAFKRVYVMCTPRRTFPTFPGQWNGLCLAYNNYIGPLRNILAPFIDG